MKWRNIGGNIWQQIKLKAVSISAKMVMSSGVSSGGISANASKSMAKASKLVSAKERYRQSAISLSGGRRKLSEVY